MFVEKDIVISLPPVRFCVVLLAIMSVGRSVTGSKGFENGQEMMKGLAREKAREADNGV